MFFPFFTPQHISRQNVVKASPGEDSETKQSFSEFRLGKFLSDERGLPFYSVKNGFLEYL